MRNPTEPADTPPSNAPARRRRHTSGLALTLSALVGGLLAFSPVAPAKAWSENCMDGYPAVTVQLLTGNFGLPVWLGFESYSLDGSPGVAAVCYGTGAPGDGKAAGGMADARLEPSSNGVGVGYSNRSDSNAAIQANTSATSQPTYTLTPGGTSGGQALTFSIPVNVCVGPCQPGTQPADGPTGVLLGSISRESASGDSAAYRVDNLCVKVDGATVLGNCNSNFLGSAGVTTTGINPVNTSPATPGPCVLGECAPNFNYVGTTGLQIATVYIPAFGTVPVYGVRTCLYQKDAATTCPA